MGWFGDTNERICRYFRSSRVSPSSVIIPHSITNVFFFLLYCIYILFSFIYLFCSLSYRIDVQYSRDVNWSTRPSNTNTHQTWVALSIWPHALAIAYYTYLYILASKYRSIVRWVDCGTNTHSHSYYRSDGPLRQFITFTFRFKYAIEVSLRW